METIKPKDKKYLRELYFNPTLTLVFIILLVLSVLNVIVISDNFNINEIFKMLLVALIIIFFVKSIVNLFYSVKISDEIITFNTPFNMYRKRFAFSAIEDYRFKTEKTQDDTLVFFLKTGEVISVGISRYSREQKKYIAKKIEELANISG
ncbi:MAG: hypothetical protein WBK59_04410 [Acholeplasmatales bacterium]|jgi:hypothetical protein|nr:hypothetical protein [Acholeplasmatales bacterium]